MGGICVVRGLPTSAYVRASDTGSGLGVDWDLGGLGHVKSAQGAYADRQSGPQKIVLTMRRRGILKVWMTS